MQPKSVHIINKLNVLRLPHCSSSNCLNRLVLCFCENNPLAEVFNVYLCWGWKHKNEKQGVGWDVGLKTTFNNTSVDSVQCQCSTSTITYHKFSQHTVPLPTLQVENMANQKNRKMQEPATEPFIYSGRLLQSFITSVCYVLIITNAIYNQVLKEHIQWHSKV